MFETTWYTISEKLTLQSRLLTKKNQIGIFECRRKVIRHAVLNLWQKYQKELHRRDYWGLKSCN